MSICTVYSLDDSSGDTSFSNFNMGRAPSYLFSVLRDIMAVNGYLKVHILPWSPVRVVGYDSELHITDFAQPAWMKTAGTMNGGSLRSDLVSVCKSRFAALSFTLEAHSM